MLIIFIDYGKQDAAQIRNKGKYKNLDLQVRVRYWTTTLGEQCVDVSVGGQATVTIPGVWSCVRVPTSC